MRSKTHKLTKFQTKLEDQHQSRCYQNIMKASVMRYCKLCKTQISNFTYSQITFRKNKKHQFPEQITLVCLHCFSKIQNFSDIAQYRIIGNLNHSILDPQWTAKEQLLLFQGMYNHGFQNWSQISDFIGTKTQLQVEEHYNQYFLQVPNFLPNSNVIPPKKNRSVSHQKINQKTMRKSNKSKIKNQKPVGLASSQKLIEVQDYFPKRRQFQCQFDDDAEIYLAEMEFDDDDTAEEIQLKLKTIEFYNQRIQQRYLKTDFVCSRGLLDLKKQTEIDKKMNSEERDLRGMMKIFQRFLPANQYQRLIEGLLFEKQQKQKIKIYQDLSDKGIKSLLEAHKAFVYIHHKNHLNRDLRHRKDKLDSLLPKKQQRQALESNRHNSLLQKDQLALCKELKLSGLHYIIIKQTIERELKKHSKVNLQDLYKIFNFEQNVIYTIIDLLRKKKELILDGEFICQ